VSRIPKIAQIHCSGCQTINVAGRWSRRSGDTRAEKRFTTQTITILNATVPGFHRAGQHGIFERYTTSVGPVAAEPDRTPVGRAAVLCPGSSRYGGGSSSGRGLRKNLRFAAADGLSIEAPAATVRLENGRVSRPRLSVYLERESTHRATVLKSAVAHPFPADVYFEADRIHLGATSALLTRATWSGPMQRSV
jgi:hypothetical protein